MITFDLKIPCNLKFIIFNNFNGHTLINCRSRVPKFIL